MDEVAYARFKANMTFEEVMAALAETDYSFTQQDMIELEGILDDLDPVLLELLRQRPQF